MNQALPLLVVGSALLLANCATPPATTSTSSPAAAAEQPASAGEPRTVTDLSQLSSARVADVPMPQGNTHAAPDAGESKPNPNTVVQENLERLVVANAGQLRYREGRTEAPGSTVLLNDRARKFSEFSYQLLNQTLAAARTIEPTRLKGRKLAQQIAPIVLTGIMDSQGRLTEISIESHSGDRQVDQIIIDACKQGLWSRNPPSQAIDSDGNYRLRIRGYISSYSFDFKGRYKYRTDLGLGIL